MIPTRGWAIAVSASLVALVLVLVRYPSLEAQEKPGAAGGALPLQGKVLLVYLRSKTIEHPDALEEVSLTEVGGRQALVGKWIASTNPAHWTTGLRTTIMLDDVSSIIEFADMAEYTRRAAAATQVPNE